ncbi:MAG: LPP20 family lipoprotein [Thiohalomonadales bacterium]
MSTLRSFIFVIFFLIITACNSSGPKKPDWVNGLPEDYPPQSYLSGHGQSKYRAIAQDHARADLSKIFQVKLSEQSEDNVEFKGEIIKGKRLTQLQFSSSRNIKTSIDQVVSGIRIAESWQDPQSKQYHALALLDRNKMANGLRQTINQQDIATEKEIAQSQQHSELMVKINYANRALALQQSRQANQRILAIIDPTGIGVPPHYNPAALLADRDALLSRLHIAVEITNDSIGDIESIVTGALARTGFQHEKNNDSANYLLKTRLDVDQSHDKKGWYWYRGSLQINLTNQKTGQDSGNFRWEIKVSAQNPELAMQRVRDTVNRKLSNELRVVIIKLGLAQ